MRRRVFAQRATWEPSENTWVLTGGWVRDFDGSKITRYSPFKVESLPEISEPPTYFRREVRQYYQMNWRQLGEYIISLHKAGFDTARYVPCLRTDDLVFRLDQPAEARHHEINATVAQEKKIGATQYEHCEKHYNFG